jgi:two-component system, chemotaxis family, sensor kinase CheA
LNIVNYLETKYTDDPHVENLFETVSFLDLVTSDMQIAVMKMRMQPIKKVFSKFPRVVRDIAASLDKEVDLKISGEDTEVDKSVMEQIGDPLVHIIRNAIDHGIESTEVRRRMGKPEKGTISISASQKGNHIVIEVSDNGKGIDVERVKKKAVEKALMSEEEAQRMTQDAAVNLVFLPGFTTADVASELSGRGVGMDVVKTNISKLNGYVEIDTRRDTGTTFRISIPLTLAIVQALMVKTGGGQYAIPLAPIEGTLKVEKKEISDVVRKKVLIVRGRVHPFFELSGILGGNGSGDLEHRYAIVISAGESRFCIGVDELLGQEEVVIKSIDGIDTSSAHILGATITGDGRVVLILDVASIARSVSSLKRKR